MNSFKKILLSASLNFRKWRCDWRAPVAFIGLLCFYWWNVGGFGRFGADNGLDVTAWVLPFAFSNEVMILLFCYFEIALFSDAPFMDGQTFFVLARTGRFEWIVGQIIYIVLAALIYALFMAFAPLPFLLPNISFSGEWGKGVYALVENYDVLSSYKIAMVPTMDLLMMVSPAKAMLVCTLMAWLCGMFIGGIMLCANLISGTYLGTLICSLLSFMTYFSVYVGPKMLGEIIYWISPLNWVCIYGLDWMGGTGMPSPAYGITVLLAGIIVTFTASAFAFCKRDVAIRQGGILQ